MVDDRREALSTNELLSAINLEVGGLKPAMFSACTSTVASTSPPGMSIAALLAAMADAAVDPLAEWMTAQGFPPPCCKLLLSVDERGEFRHVPAYVCFSRYVSKGQAVLFHDVLRDMRHG